MSSSLHISPLSVEALNHAYPHGIAIEEISFSVEPGKMIALIGPNGAGKTTLLHRILGILPSKKGEGSVLFWGQPLEKVREKVAFLPQKHKVEWNFPITVEEVVMMGAFPRWRWTFSPPQEVKDLTQNYLNKVGLLTHASRLVDELSGGQQQRLFMARALMQQADLYILDEPFAGVDHATESELFLLLQQLVAGGATVCIVHHDLSTLADRFDTILMINRTLIGYGTPKEVLTSEKISQAYGLRDHWLMGLMELLSKK